MYKIKKFFGGFFNEKNPIRLTLFNIIVGCGIAGGLISLAVTVIIGLGWIESVIVLVTEAFLFLAFYLANFKGRLEAAVAVISVSVSLVLLPWLFFAGGGVESGMPFWFVMGIIFEFLLASGKMRLIFVLLDITVYSLCFLADYSVPGCVERIRTLRGVYLDKWQSMVVLSVVVGIVLCFQNRAHMRLHRKDIKQKRELDEARREAEEAKEAYRSLAFVDLMTGLNNRTAFESRMERLRCAEKEECAERDGETGTAEEAGEKPPVIIMVADLNYLKRINDRWGHGSGDKAIKEAAELLREEFGENSGCYRIGGDEFCVISESMTEEEFEGRFDCFVSSVSDREKGQDGREFGLSVAAGYAVAGNGGVDCAFRAADRNMYSRKTEMKQSGAGMPPD